MRYNRQKWQARAVVPSALQDLQGFEVDGTWNVPNSPPWKAVSDESHLSMIGAPNARVTSTLSGHSPLVRALHLFVHSMSEIFLPNAGSSSIPGDQGGWRKRELNP
jgi:hypothetical protein